MLKEACEAERRVQVLWPFTRCLWMESRCVAAWILVASENAGRAPPQLTESQWSPVEALFSVTEVIAARRFAIEVRMRLL